MPTGYVGYLRLEVRQVRVQVTGRSVSQGPSIFSMTRRRLALTLTTAVIAGSVALAGAPAVAQDSGRQPTTFRYSLPGSVNADSTSFTLPGNVVTRKSRGAKDLGKVSLADVAEKVARLQAQGREVISTITIDGVTRRTKGVPTLLADGTVKVRISKGRGSRTIVLPRASRHTSTVNYCPDGTTMIYYADGSFDCMPNY